MTTKTDTTITPELRLTIVKHLASGKDLDTAAALTRLDRSTVLDIGSKHGYPSVEKLGWAVDVLAEKLDVDQALPARSAPTRPAAGASIPPAAGPTLLTRPDEIRVLLNTAKGHPSKRIQHQADRVIDAVDRLRTMIAEDQEKHAEKRRLTEERAAARAEVERLEAQLRAAREKLRGPKTSSTKAATTNAGDGPTSAEIRQWARGNSIDCPTVGRVPSSVREAYDADHAAAAS